MKSFYSCFTKILATTILFISLQSSLKAQVLNAGDIVFTGYVSGATNEGFSFVPLVTINLGTTITFTDNGWDGAALGATEQTIVWTATASVPAGREIHISGPALGAATAVYAGSGASAGTVSGAMLSLPSAGDQILAYRGTSLAPTFISGIHMNQYCTCILECGTTTVADWDPATCVPGPNASRRPTGLVTGTNAIWIGTEGVANTDADNAVFNCTGPLTTAAQVRAAVNNPANWTKENGVPTITLPSRCTFLNLFVLPVQLTTFTGKLNSDKSATLQWKVADQQGVQEYIVEESQDGVQFTRTGSVQAGASMNYSLNDPQVATGNNHYRLSIVEQSGRTTYSNIVLLNLKAGIKVNVFPNPVNDKLTIQQFGTMQNKTAVLSDANGKVLQQVNLVSQEQTINMQAYPRGIYVLKMEDGTVFKVVKQ